MEIGKLDLMLGDFNEVEYSVESLIITLKNLDSYEKDNNVNLKSYLNIIIRNLESIDKDMRKTINELDEYILSQPKNK